MEKSKTFILGGGASLTKSVYNKVNSYPNAYIIAVNFAYKFCEPDAIVFLDQDVYFKNKQEIEAKQARLISKQFEIYPSHIEQYKDLFKGKHHVLSGIFAVSWALSQGLDNIYLFGMDCKPTLNDKGELVTHHHDYSSPHDKFTGSEVEYEHFKGRNVYVVGDSNINCLNKIEAKDVFT